VSAWPAEGASAKSTAPRAPFPFLVGCGRSGTTLLRAMIDSHPAIAVSHESEWIVPLGRARATYELPSGFDGERFVADLLSHSWAGRVGMPEDEIRSALEADRPADLTSAVRSAFDAYARRHGKHRAGDKTPAYVIHIDLLADVMPEGRFVHIVRDGRDVAMSYMDVPFGPKDVREAAVFWQRRVRAGQASGRRLGPGRYLELRYEDLVESPEARLREVCAFLELGFDPVMLRYHERAGELVAAARHPQHHGHLFHSPEKGVRDWRRQMAPDDVALFEALSGDLLRELGYERSGNRAPLRVRLDAASVRLREGVRQRRRARRRATGASAQGPVAKATEAREGDG
jgi:sulfotransferase family protein